MATGIKHGETGASLSKTEMEGAALHEITADLDVDTHKVVNVVDPTEDQHGATKAYVDSAVAPKFQDFIGCATKDGFTLDQAGGGSVTPQVAMFHFSTAGATATNHTHLRSTNTWQSLVADGKLVTVEWIIAYVTSVVTVTRRLYMTAGSGAPPSDTGSHFGFKIVDGDISASNADGANQRITDTDVNLATGGQMTRLKVVLNRATNVKFYVNDVLKVTHTDRFPGTGSFNWNVGLVLDDDADRDMFLGRTLIEREY